MHTDFHIHSSFSADSDTPMEAMVQAGIGKGLSVMCFTEHMDIDFANDPDCAFEVDTAAYRRELLRLKERYASQIELLFGIELGLQPHLAQRHRDYLSGWPFDFVIGSSHLINGQDPYYPEFFQGKQETDCYRSYFQSVLDNLKAFSGMDVYGHLDYVVRYGPNKDRYGTFERIKQKYKCCRALAKGTQGVARASVVRAEIADVFFILRLGKNDSKAQRAQQIRCRRAHKDGEQKEKT